MAEQKLRPDGKDNMAPLYLIKCVICGKECRGKCCFSRSSVVQYWKRLSVLSSTIWSPQIGSSASLLTVLIKMENQLSEEQIKDVEEREAKALAFLKELELTPAAQMSFENVGGDRFVSRVQPYLQDTRYSKGEIVSPFIEK